MICGIDEAGRGTLAGPLVVAGVILKNPVSGLKDSKKLSPKKREELAKIIIQSAEYKICVFSSKKIDESGLSFCLAKALKTIKTSLKANRYIFDGSCNYGQSNIETIVKADKTIAQVSAASILAKHNKDKILLKLAKDYPNFSFASHQGYATQKHIEEIKKFGKTPIHRQSFKLKNI